MKQNRNYGIQVSGSGQLHASQLAVGKGARLEGNTSNVTTPSTLKDLDEVRRVLGAIVEQLRAGAPGLDDAPALAAVAESAQREAGKAKPSKAILAGLLDALMAGVAKVAALAGAVEAVQHAVSTLL